MFKNSRKIEEYKYDGVFYTNNDSPSPDGDLLKEDVITEIILLETKCDVQKANDLSSSATLVSLYNVYFPFIGNIPIHNGCKLRVTVEGVKLDGNIYDVSPTQMGACSAKLKV